MSPKKSFYKSLWDWLENNRLFAMSMFLGVCLLATLKWSNQVIEESRRLIDSFPLGRNTVEEFQPCEYQDANNTLTRNYLHSLNVIRESYIKAVNDKKKYPYELAKELENQLFKIAVLTGKFSDEKESERCYRYAIEQQLKTSEESIRAAKINTFQGEGVSEENSGFTNADMSRMHYANVNIAEEMIVEIVRESSSKTSFEEWYGRWQESSLEW